ncbi:hypothetical protein MMC13_002288 [Lambiella insularis]|nr:hypothetical protein [Lambiella insularis]
MRRLLSANITSSRLNVGPASLSKLSIDSNASKWRVQDFARPSLAGDLSSRHSLSSVVVSNHHSQCFTRSSFHTSAAGYHSYPSTLKAAPSTSKVGPTSPASSPGGGNPIDPFNTPSELRRLRCHLGLSRYAKSVEEAHLGRSLQRYISGLALKGDQGTLNSILSEVARRHVARNIDRGDLKDGIRNFVSKGINEMLNGFRSQESDSSRFRRLMRLLGKEASWHRKMMFTKWDYMVVIGGIFLLTKALG